MSKAHFRQTDIGRRMQRGESIPAWRPPELRSKIGLPDGELSPTRHSAHEVLARDLAARCERIGFPLLEAQVDVITHCLAVHFRSER